MLRYEKGDRPPATVKNDLTFWLDAIEALLLYVRDLLRYGDSETLARATAVTQRAAREMLATVRRLRSPLVHRNVHRRPTEPSLEQLENDFRRLRNAAELALQNANKGKHRGRRGNKEERSAAKDTLHIARALGEMTHIAASALKAEMERRDAWNEKWAREIGLLNWL